MKFLWAMLILTFLSWTAFAAPVDLTAKFTTSGLSSLHSGDAELLAGGKPGVNYVQLEEKTRNADGVTDVADYHFERRADETPKTSFSPGKKSLLQTYSWGTARYNYKPAPGRLDITLTLTNTTVKTLADFSITLASLRFATKPTGIDPAKDNLKSSLDNLALSTITLDDRQLLLCNMTMDPPFMLGLGKTDATTGIYPLRLTGGVQAVAAGAFDIPPYGQPRIAPGKSLSLTISLRTIASNVTADSALTDIYAAFAHAYPPIGLRTDRRPIGMVMLPSKGHISDSNPRGWFDDKTLDIQTAAGQEKFRAQMLKFADQSVQSLKATGAQGMIVWDLEGDENPQPVTYVGDPRLMKKLDPEMDAVADAFFQKFTDAGLKVGCCIRPTQVYFNTTTKKWDHGSGSDSGPGRGNDYEKLKPADLPWWRFYPIAERLADKISYAKERWGCTIFYIDTNGIFRPLGLKGDFYWQLVTAIIWKQIKMRHPDVLLIPELPDDKWAHHVANWAYTATYMELDLEGYGTPASVRKLIPSAFSIVNVNDGPIEEKRALLVDAVRKGDILLFRGWFGDSRNATVKDIYEEAARGVTK